MSSKCGRAISSPSTYFKSVSFVSNRLGAMRHARVSMRFIRYCGVRNKTDSLVRWVFNVMGPQRAAFLLSMFTASVKHGTRACFPWHLITRACLPIPKRSSRLTERRLLILNGGSHQIRVPDPSKKKCGFNRAGGTRGGPFSVVFDRHVCKFGSWRYCCGPAFPELVVNRRLRPTNALQNCASAYEAKLLGKFPR